MEINVLIRTYMDSDFSLSTSIEGVYTNLKRKELEREWIAKGKALVSEHIKTTCECYNDLKSGKIMNENIPAIQNMKKRRMEQEAHKLGRLEALHTDEEYKKYYVRCQGFNWEKYTLVE